MALLCELLCPYLTLCRSVSPVSVYRFLPVALSASLCRSPSASICRSLCLFVCLSLSRTLTFSLCSSQFDSLSATAKATLQADMTTLYRETERLQGFATLNQLAAAKLAQRLAKKTALNAARLAEVDVNSLPQLFAPVMYIPYSPSSASLHDQNAGEVEIGSAETLYLTAAERARRSNNGAGGNNAKYFQRRRNARMTSISGEW